MARSTPS